MWSIFLTPCICIWRFRKEIFEGILYLCLLVCPGITDSSPISGYPSIIVPAGYGDDDMPFGITFVGRPFTEPLLIQAAYAFEQAVRARKAPCF